MGTFHNYERYIKLRITTAEAEMVFRRLLDRGIILLDIQKIDYLTIDLFVHKYQIDAVEECLKNANVSYCLLERRGWIWYIFDLKKRPVLVIGLLAFLVFTLWLPTRTLFVKVEGNVKLPEKLILEQASACGIHFGSSSKAVRSEKVKNALLQMNPQLQWVGVNTAGCVATISVRERSIPQLEDAKKAEVSSIIAGIDGVISEMVVLSGNSLCKVGQRVSVGDVLISGYTDCGIKIQAEVAKGEVFAYTMRQFTFVSPVPSGIKGEITGKHVCCHVKLGKKVIKLCNHSGIYSGSCDKMYVEKYLTLPGGFSLPVSLVYEVYLLRTSEELFSTPENSAGDWMACYATQYVTQQMLAGQILHAEQTLTGGTDFCQLIGIYACEEMIGKVKYEETINTYAENY